MAQASNTRFQLAASKVQIAVMIANFKKKYFIHYGKKTKLLGSWVSQISCNKQHHKAHEQNGERNMTIMHANSSSKQNSISSAGNFYFKSSQTILQSIRVNGIRIAVKLDIDKVGRLGTRLPRLSKFRGLFATAKH